MAPLVALAGFMGSGKSSVGSVAARLLGWRFVDLDEQIVKSEGMPIAEFFVRHGEAEFRQREVEALRAVLPASRGGVAGDHGLVLALGGGTLQGPEAAAMLEEHGRVIFLDVDVDRAWERAHGKGRPLAQDPDAFRALLARRRPSYERTADWILPVGDRGVDELARQVAGIVRATGAAWPESWGIQLVSTERPSTVVGGPRCLTSLQERAEEAGSRGARVFVVTDENVGKAWGVAVRQLLGAVAGGGEPLVMAAGEQSKTVGNLGACWEWLAARGVRRDDIVLALGGGVVGDLAGFAAATYQRGVGLWQVPTSLLAQVDSSVGGKTAVNLEAGKNLAGVFYQPDLVVIDPDTLATLPQAEFTNGLGEVVKYGLLEGEGLFGRLEADWRSVQEREARLLSDIIKTSVRYKAAVVAEDEFDTGRRAVLNLGHTTAHALEVSLGYGRLRHGEAVGLGLLVALAVSERLVGLAPEVRSRTRALLGSLGLPVSLELPPADALKAAAGKDKKVTAGSAGFVGLRALGDPVCQLTLPDGLFEEALEVIRA
jgi:shikimate kinase/3-dehydroquinate synthase